MCCCFFSESLFVGILSRCSNLPGKGRTLALARGKLSGGVLHRHRCFSSWRRSSVVWLLAPMLTLTRPGCQVIDKLFSFWRFKTTPRFCMVLWFLFSEPCLWICFFLLLCWILAFLRASVDRVADGPKRISNSRCALPEESPPFQLATLALRMSIMPGWFGKACGRFFRGCWLLRNVKTCPSTFGILPLLCH